MDQRSRAVVASAAIVAIFLVVQFGALALVEPFQDAGFQTVDDPGNLANSIVYVVAILVVTALLLGAIKFDLDLAIRGFIVFAGAYISVYVFQMALPEIAVLPTIGPFHSLAWAAGAVLGLVLWIYPEWYVIDAAGVIMGVGAAGLFGITFAILPALVLLVVLAVYDAISVYGTEHMLALASGVMEMRVPIVLVIPLTLSYSFLDADLPDPAGDRDEATAGVESETGSEARSEANAAAATDPAGNAAPMADRDVASATNDATARDDVTATDDATARDDATDAEGADAPGDAESPLDREALFIGLGDAIIPAILVASAGYFLTDVPTVGIAGLDVALPAVAAMVGTTAGLLVLLRMVLAGRAHAGLPLLNGGAIAGYLVGALASGLSITQALGLESLL